MEYESLLLTLCRAALTEDSLDASALSALDADGWGELYRLAKHHDLCHIVAEGVSRLAVSPPDGILSKLERQRMIALYRTEQMTFELASLTAVLGERSIPHLPLKGSVLRELYPSPELRLSCDIDLLVSRRDLAAAREALVSIGYTDEGENSHDVQLYAPSGLHVELHFDLIESGYLPEAAALLEDVFRYASPEPDRPFTYRLSDEMFYFYHIAHMAKHFSVTGGCGVRPFLDLFILSLAGRCGDADARAELLLRGGLSAFEAAATELSQIWMRGEAHTPRSAALSSFVLTGGVYGAVENRVAVSRGKGKGRLAYLLSRLLPSYRFMIFRYPILRRLPILLPFLYVVRILSPLWSGRRRQILREARVSTGVSSETLHGTEALLSELGLL